MRKIENIDQLEEFILKHGEAIVDLLGGEIDRIEMKLRVICCFFGVNYFCDYCFISEKASGDKTL